MSKKPKDSRKGKAKASDLKINKDTVQSLSDDELGEVQGGRMAQPVRTLVPPLTLKLCPGK